IDANVYVRHERGGLMLGGYEADPLQLDAGTLPPSFAMPDFPLDIEVLWRLARSVRDQFPIFEDPAIRVAEHRGGLPTLTMDDRYLVGPLPGVAGPWGVRGGGPGGAVWAAAGGAASACRRRSARRSPSGSSTADRRSIFPRSPRHASPETSRTSRRYASAAAGPTRLTTARAPATAPPETSAQGLR